jgi:hypothetical protein
VGVEFELRASHLQSKHSTSWVTPPVYFGLVILEMGSHELFPWAGLESRSSQFQSPKWLELQECHHTQLMITIITQSSAGVLVRTPLFLPVIVLCYSCGAVAASSREVKAPSPSSTRPGRKVQSLATRQNKKSKLPNPALETRCFG